MVVADSGLLILLILTTITITTPSVSTDDVDFSQATLDPATGLMCVYNQGNLQSNFHSAFRYRKYFIEGKISILN